MKSLCLALAGVLAFFAIVANGKSAFLRVGNKFGDYWVFRFAGKTINVRFDVDHKTQKETDREINVSDIDLGASFHGALASQVVERPDGANLAKIRLFCNSSNPYCVYSHFDSTTYHELDILCTNEVDCVAFVQAALSVP